MNGSTKGGGGRFTCFILLMNVFLIFIICTKLYFYDKLEYM